MNEKLNNNISNSEYESLILNNIENNFICFEQELDVSEEGVVFAHEIDHQRGTLISEIGKEVFMW